TGAIASAAAQGAAPDLRLELADIWPHFATVATGGSGGPRAGAVPPGRLGGARPVGPRTPHPPDRARGSAPPRAPPRGGLDRSEGGWAGAAGRRPVCGRRHGAPALAGRHHHRGPLRRFPRQRADLERARHPLRSSETLLWAGGGW